MIDDIGNQQGRLAIMEKTENLIKLYEAGLTIKEIADRVNASYETVRKLLKGKVKWSRNYISDLTPEQIENILKRFDEKQSIDEIAKWYEISKPAIYKLLKANNRKFIASDRKYDILRDTPINSIQKQFIVGTLLGDGTLYKEGKNSMYKLSFRTL